MLEDLKKNTFTNAIAFAVLGVFSLLLIIVLIKATQVFTCVDVDCNTKEGEIWLSLFKDGFLLLGGAFTTLIGYYFGNRGSEQALANAETVKKEAEKLLAERGKDEPQVTEDEDEISGMEEIN